MGIHIPVFPFNNATDLCDYQIQLMSFPHRGLYRTFAVR